MYIFVWLTNAAHEDFGSRRIFVLSSFSILRWTGEAAIVSDAIDSDSKVVTAWDCKKWLGHLAIFIT